MIGGSSAVSSFIAKCVVCRRLRGSLQKQKMAELPSDRLEPAPPLLIVLLTILGLFMSRREGVKSNAGESSSRVWPHVVYI